MTCWNGTRMNVGSFSGRIRGVIFIKGLLAIIHQIEGFPGREITFPFDIVLE